MEKRWITGDEILERWNAQPFELLKAFENGLPAYFKETGGIIKFDREKHIPKFENLGPGDTFMIDPGVTMHMEWKVSRFLRNDFDNHTAFGEVVFKLAEVQEYEQKHGMGPEASKQAPETTDRTTTSYNALSVPEGTKWHDIFIRVEADAHRLAVDTGVGARILTYEELGLETKKDLADILERFARKEKITTDEKQNVSRLRKIIKDLLPIDGEPLPCNDGIYSRAFRIEN